MNVSRDRFRGAIEVAIERPERLRLSFSAGLLDSSRSGQVAVRLRTPKAMPIAALPRHWWRRRVRPQ